MKINKLIKKSLDTASNKGFHKTNDDLLKIASNEKDKKILNDLIKSQKLMLMVSELSEALESIRENRYSELSNTEKEIMFKYSDELFVAQFERNVKDTFEDEIADVFIRLGDLCGKLDIDIETHIKLKQKYNDTRDKMHGKNF